MHMRDLLAEMEVVEGADIGAAEAVAEPAAEAATEAVETTPATEAAPAGWTPDDPAFIDAVDARAAEVANVQFQQLLQRFEAENVGAQTAPGEPIDLNELLNPLNDGFGQNIGQFLQQRDEYLLSQVKEMFQPFQSRFQNETVQEGMQRVADIIDDDFSRNGAIELGEGAPDPKKVIQEIAPLYLGEMESRYGQGSPRAAEQALAKATGMVRSIVTAAEKRGAAQNANQLATLSSANREPGTGGGAIRAAGEAESVDDALARWRGEAA